MVLKWEEIKCEMMAKSFFGNSLTSMFRAKIPGGWFVRMNSVAVGGAFFYPDPEHIWDGSSLP